LDLIVGRRRTRPCQLTKLAGILRRGGFWEISSIFRLQALARPLRLTPITRAEALAFDQGVLMIWVRFF
jgi:hypothetical protein